MATIDTNEDRERSIFNKLTSIAAPVMDKGAFFTDLIHDTRRLADAEPGETFVWAVTAMGTHLAVIHSDYADCLPSTEPRLYFTLTVEAFGRISLTNRKLD